MAAAGALPRPARHLQRLLCLAAASLSAYARRDAELDVRIRALFTKARQRYGSPRIHDDLREAGLPVSRKRIARLMRQAGLRARQRKRNRSTTMSEHDQPIAPNHFAQTVVAEGHPGRGDGLAHAQSRRVPAAVR